MVVIDSHLAEFRKKVSTMKIPVEGADDVAMRLMRTLILDEFDSAIKLMEEDRLERMKLARAAFDEEITKIEGETS